MTAAATDQRRRRTPPRRQVLWPVERVEQLCERLIGKLEPATAGITMTGELRRRRPAVATAQLLMIPVGGISDAVDAVADDLGLHVLERGRRLYAPQMAGLTIYLNRTTRTRWPVDLLTTTGSRSFVDSLDGDGWRIADGWLWRRCAGDGAAGGAIRLIDGVDYESVPVRDEAELLDLLGVGWIPPPARR